MSFFKNLFGKKTEPAQEVKPIAPEYSIDEKLKYKVYPRIKNINSQNFQHIYHKPLGGDLTLIFVQDINDRFSYIQKSEAEQLMHLIDEWQNNIQEVESELFTTEELAGSIYFNEPGDYSNEKIFDPNFINYACEKLNTDKVIVSIARRHMLQVTNFYNDFKDNEMFFWRHFSAWRNSDLPDEVISEYVLIGEKDKGITDIVLMGFRMNAYEKDGKYVLSYSVFDDGDSPIGDKIDFAEIIERRKEKLTY